MRDVPEVKLRDYIDTVILAVALLEKEWDDLFHKDSEMIDHV